MLQCVTILPTGALLVCYTMGVVKGHPPMVTITEKSTKPEIISAALELTDHQAATIERLQQQQRILWAALAALTAWALL